MKLVDANILLYAYDERALHHAPAKSWLEAALSGAEPVRFAWVTVLAFIRITTNPRVFERPLSLEDSFRIVRSWLERPNVDLIPTAPAHLQGFEAAATAGQASGPLVMDAHLAALALENGATLFTTDRDFARFEGLRFVDPRRKA